MARDNSSKELADTRAEANGYVIEESDLRNIKSLDDALALMDSFDGAEDFSDYGSGFEVIDNKDVLIGVPFLAMEWRFTRSKQYGGEFVSILTITKDGVKGIVNDGSTGICAQMRRVTDERIAAGRRNPQTGLVVSRGLRRSDYTTEVNGNSIEASTYYLA